MTHNELAMKMIKLTSWYRTEAIKLEAKDDHILIYPNTMGVFNAIEVLAMLETAGFSTYIDYDHKRGSCYARTY
jgi:thiazole synthase ThiGH ThiG subunit